MSYIDITQSPYNSDPTGAVNCSAALVSANSATSSDTIVFPKGTYLVTSNVTFSRGKKLIFDAGARLKPASGVTITIRCTIQADPHSWIFDTSLGGTFAGKAQIEKVYSAWFGAQLDATTSDLAATQAAIDFIQNYNGGTLYTPRGFQSRIDGDLSITKPFLIFEGGGELIGATFVVGYTVKQEYQLKIRDMVLTNDTLTSGKHVVRALNANIVEVYDNRIKRYDSILDVEPINGTISNNCQWLRVYDNFFHDCNYVMKVRKLATEDYVVSDSLVADNEGVAFIAHVDLDGMDGVTLDRNVFFFPGHEEQSQTKTSNIIVKNSTWVQMNSNHLFEAGFDACEFTNVQSVTGSGNHIAWPGQRRAGSGMRFKGGDVDGGNRNIVTLSDNIVEFPTDDGFSIEDNCGTITLGRYIVIDAGNAGYYYGSDTLPTEHFAVDVSAAGNFVLVSDGVLPDNKNRLQGNVHYQMGNFDMDKNVITSFRSKTATGTGTEISVKGVEHIFLAQTSPTVLTNLVDGYDGQVVTLEAQNNNTSLAWTGAGFKLDSLVNLLLKTGDSITLRCRGGIWRECGRDFSRPSSRVQTVTTISGGLLNMNSHDQANVNFASPQTISLLTSGSEGRVIRIKALNDNTTLANGYMLLYKGQNVKIPAGGWVELLFTGSNWEEINRSFPYPTIVNVLEFTVGGNTIPWGGYDRINLNVPAPHTVTVLPSAGNGTIKKLKGITGNTTIAYDSSYMKLKGGVNCTIPVDGVLILEYQDSGWIEIGGRNW